ncbi:hypothetical protein [Acinetobacter venetianus]|uniref:hypothetical protein n=1 Tax=Acinetobacter venetianus TaxID=52133 RepID=UPI00214F7F55|nr:hypothetical protein [Acinetobacter venetianus]MCR4532806.1 hypothetical protein [Acinetobacter venetianus]
MNAAVNHIMQNVDWSKYDLPTWLKQFGYWQGTASRTFNGGENPIAAAMKKAKLRLSKKQKAQIIADYMCTEEVEKFQRSKYSCQITDDEARAVQRLVIDIINGTDSEILLEWMQAVISKFFNQESWSKMAVGRTTYEARQDVKFGLAALHCRYSFIEYERKTIDDELVDPAQG